MILTITELCLQCHQALQQYSAGAPIETWTPAPVFYPYATLEVGILHVTMRRRGDSDSYFHNPLIIHKDIIIGHSLRWQIPG